MARTCLAIILAAGDGTRMKSAKSKVLHEVGNLPMIAHVVRNAADAGVSSVALVVGRDAEAVEEAAHSQAEALTVWRQQERLGTAHAVLCAAGAIEHGFDDILVIFGDTPLVTAETLRRSRTVLADGADVAVLGFRTGRPHGYGRLIVREGELLAIVEERDASEAERRIEFCNGGLMAISGRKALALLRSIGNDNAKSEYYLSDIVSVARDNGGRAVAVEVDYEELIGINTRLELAEVERIWQQRRRRELMLSGVGMTDPDSVFLSYDTVVEEDVQIEPNVVFGPGVTVKSGAAIRAFSHIEGATVGQGCTVGPFARLRPGAILQQGARVGNFCEVKNADIGEGAKVNHLTYIGDATIGGHANIGAGTITCNYDGVNKHQTTIGPGAFIGSNSALVAPVTVGADSYVASGSVVTDDVPDNAVAFGRARQENKPGLASRFRERNAAEKERRQREKK